MSDQPWKPDPEGEVKITFSNLKELASLETPEALEAGVKVSSELLSQLKQCLYVARDNKAAAKMISSITDLQKKAKTERTVVGVVGGTGTGKSSTINAVLDEERIIPTNCVRACTAVITELSWNSSDDPEQLYRAEIEFITKKDWMKELTALFSDIAGGGNDVSQEAPGADADASIAWAKLKAIYPSYIRKDDLIDTCPSHLMEQAPTCDVLGTTKTIYSKDAKTFYEKLRMYVDSKEKTKESKKHGGEKEVIEFWPLIKVVKIFVKADVLSTGLVLVDLPGVADSNAARTAVAEKYVQQCSALWVVAPITRAVDDKTSHELLGNTFKRQVQLDGVYSQISFICTKTDDISVTEAIENLKLTEDLTQVKPRLEDLKVLLEEKSNASAAAKDNIAQIKLTVAQYDRIIDDLEEKLANIKDEESDTVVQVLQLEPQKRKAPQKASSRRKRSRKGTDTHTADSGVLESPSTEHSDDDDAEGSATNPMAVDEAEKRLKELKAERKSLKEKKKPMDRDAKSLREEITALKTEMSSLRSEETAFCIQSRNTYSREAIKQQFANGIRELDQEAAAAEDEDDFDPSLSIRDYNEIAEALPVFCVSSRAFQKMNGKLEKDVMVCGFRDVHDTEIPQLKQHGKHLTKAARIASCKRFLNETMQLLNALTMWVIVGTKGLQLADSDKQLELDHFKRELRVLRKEFTSTASDTVRHCQAILKRYVFDAFPKAVTLAADAVQGTGAGWSKPRSEGGLAWGTYKAVCRREGRFKRAYGFTDFNEDLTAPMKKRIALRWEKAFSQKLPPEMNAYVANMTTKLDRFHTSMMQRSQIRNASLPISRHVVTAQIATYSQNIADRVQDVKAVINSVQREANRQFTPAIAIGMGDVYSFCAGERGNGCFKRCKAAMQEHATQSRVTMFQDATQLCSDALNSMMDDVNQELSDMASSVIDQMEHDYTNLIVGIDIFEASANSRDRLRNMLATADARFYNVKGDYGSAMNIRVKKESTGLLD